MKFIRRTKSPNKRNARIWQMAKDNAGSKQGESVVVRTAGILASKSLGLTTEEERDVVAQLIAEEAEARCMREDML